MSTRSTSNASRTSPTRAQNRTTANRTADQQGRTSSSTAGRTNASVTSETNSTQAAQGHAAGSEVTDHQRPFGTATMDESVPDLASTQGVAASSTQRQSRPGATAQMDLVDWKSNNADFDDESPYVDAGPIHVPPSVPMRTAFGEALSLWMHGSVVGENIKRPRRREDETVARAFLTKTVAPETIDRLNGMNVYAGDVSMAMRDGLSEADVVSLLDSGAGHHAFAFLIEAKDTNEYRPVKVIVERFLERWGPHTELLAERFVALARSERIKNPEELKSWYMGAGNKGVAADGYATMVNDAVDLIEAGHDLALEEMPAGMPSGLGDIIDLTEKVVYQHKRAAGKGLGANIKKAVKQLAGFNQTPGAPDGFTGVAQIDARANKHFTGRDDKFFEGMVRDLHLKKSDRFDEIQIVLDDRVLVFDSDQTLREVIKGEADPS